MKKVFLLMTMLFAFALSAWGQQTVKGTPYACQSVGMNAWTNIAFPTQSANFEIQWDTTPSASAMDSEMALSSTPVTAYVATSVPTIFQTTGVIQAMNGGSFAAVNKLSYVGGTKYHFTVDVNLTNHTFNFYVGSTTRTTIATNYAFRTTGGSPSSLSYITMYNQAAAQGGGANGTNTICNITVLTYPGTAVAHEVSLSWVATTGATGYMAYRGTTSGGPYSTTLTPAPVTTTNFVDANVLPGKTYYYVVTATRTGSTPSPYSNQATAVVPSP